MAYHVPRGSEIAPESLAALRATKTEDLNKDALVEHLQHRWFEFNANRDTVVIGRGYQLIRPGEEPADSAEKLAENPCRKKHKHSRRATREDTDSSPSSRLSTSLLQNSHRAE